MQRPSVDGRFVIIMCISSRSAQVHRPYSNADRFPLVGNAHWAFRGEKHGRMPFGQSTVKHEIDEWKLHGVGGKRENAPCGRATVKHEIDEKITV